MAELLKPREVARLLRVDPGTVRAWIRAGRLMSVKTPSGQYRIRREDVAALVPVDLPQPEAVA